MRTGFFSVNKFWNNKIESFQMIAKNERLNTLAGAEKKIAFNIFNLIREARMAFVFDLPEHFFFRFSSFSFHSFHLALLLVRHWMCTTTSDSDAYIISQTICDFDLNSAHHPNTHTHTYTTAHTSAHTSAYTDFPLIFAISLLVMKNPIFDAFFSAHFHFQ